MTTRLRFIWTEHHTTITTAHDGKEVLTFANLSVLCGRRVKNKIFTVRE
jgi:hypothetical protein